MNAKELQAKLSEAPAGTIGLALDGWSIDLRAAENTAIAGRIESFMMNRTGEPPAGRTLRQWGEGIAKSASGLAENLRLLEIDEACQQAILRSDQPSRDGDTASFFEVKLYGLTKATMHRFVADVKAGTPRQAVPFAITHEALAKLAADIAR